MHKSNDAGFINFPERKSKFLEKISIFLLLLSASFSICYWAIAKYDVHSDYKACGDALDYIKMSRHEYAGVQERYRYRILMPEIVSFLNENLKINNFLSKYYEDVDKKSIQLNFGIVNILSLALTAFLLFYYCLDLGFSRWECLTGSFLFLTSFFVVTYYTVPMVDSLASFFLMAGFYAVLRNSFLGITLSFLLGVFTKETNFLILILIILVERRLFSKKMAACIPGIIAYAIFIFTFKEKFSHNEYFFFKDILDMAKMKVYLLNSFREFNLYSAIENIETFMFLWILMIYALFKSSKPIFIKRSSWLLLFIFIVPPLARSGAVGRVVFYLFPIVIPLSLLALRDILETRESN